MRSMFVFRGVMVGSLHQRPLLLEKGFITWHYRYRSITLSCGKATLIREMHCLPKMCKICGRAGAGRSGQKWRGKQRKNG